MARKRFLPTFEVAPGPNRSLVRDAGADHHILFGVRRPDRYSLEDAGADLARKRHLAGEFEVRGVGGRSAPETDVVADWAGLRSGMRQWLADHLANVALPPRVKYGIEHVISAADQGLATDVAFLEVVPRALFRHDFSRPNAEIADWARRSVGFVVEWAGLDDRVDYELAWALATPKPARVERVFDDLHFHPRWFVADDRAGRVIVNPDKADHLRDSTNQLPQRHYVPSQALFACPAAAFIPRMHSALVDQAEASGLFEHTYWSERANHGYEEAWQMLGDLTLNAE